MAIAMLLPIGAVSVWKPRLAPLIPVALWLFIPPYFNAEFVGAGGRLHYATLAVIVIFAMMLVFKGKTLAAELSSKLGFYALISFLLLWSLLITVLSEADTSSVVLTNQTLAPFLLFLIARMTIRLDTGAFRFLALAYIFLAVVQAAFSIHQFITGSFGFYEQYFVNETWWSGTYYRSVGTQNHFLTLGAVIAVAVPLTALIERMPLRLLTLVILISGLSFSQSRLAMLVAAAGVVFVLLFSSKRPLVTLTSLAIGAALAVWATSAGILDPILSRFEDDNESNALRQIAYSWFWANWDSFIFSFSGLGHSFSVSQSAGLETSFESAFIMFTIDFGLIFAILYFGSMAAVTFISDRPLSARLAGGFAILLPMGSSALSIDSSLGMVMWFAVALASGSHLFLWSSPFVSWSEAPPISDTSSQDPTRQRSALRSGGF